MRILVCGGAGYVGSHMIRRLLQAGHSPVVFDNFSTGHQNILPAAFRGFGSPVFVEGDLLDSNSLERAFALFSYDAVIHFSAFTLIGESVSDPGKYYRNNVMGTLNLLDAMHRHQTPTFVFSSSCAVYGLPQTMPISESAPCSPINPYGYSKHMDEIMAQDFARAHGLKVVALRYFNAAGAHPDGDLGERHEPESHLIPNIIRSILGTGPALTIFGNDYPTPDGTCLRDYVHVCDLAEAHLLALEHLSQCGPGTFAACNLGTGTAVSNLEIMRSVEKVSGRYVPFSFGPRRPGDAATLYADPAMARSLLHWVPRYTQIDEIVETAWNWHKSQV